MRISDWSSDVCSSDLLGCLRIVSETHLQKIEIADDWRQKIVEIVSNSSRHLADHFDLFHLMDLTLDFFQLLLSEQIVGHIAPDGKDARIILVRIFWYNGPADMRSEEHTSELQSLMRISYAVFCLKKNTHHKS